jgi:hypothetical protein
MREMGYDLNDKERVKEMQKSAGPNYFVAFIASLVFAFILALFLHHMNARNLFLAFASHPPGIGSATGLVISYTSFFHGAALFFLLAIASCCRRKELELTLANSRRQLTGRPITPGPSYGLSRISQRSIFSEDSSANAFNFNFGLVIQTLKP